MLSSKAGKILAHRSGMCIYYHADKHCWQKQVLLSFFLSVSGSAQSISSQYVDKRDTGIQGVWRACQRLILPVHCNATCIATCAYCYGVHCLKLPYICCSNACKASCNMSCNAEVMASENLPWSNWASAACRPLQLLSVLKMHVLCWGQSIRTFVLDAFWHNLLTLGLLLPGTKPLLQACCSHWHDQQLNPDKLAIAQSLHLWKVHGYIYISLYSA